MPNVYVCLGGTAQSAPLEQEARTAAEAGFTCLDVWAPALESYLAAWPLVVLDALLCDLGIHVAAVSGMEPLAVGSREGLLLAQARLVDHCAHLDALGGGIIVVEPERHTGDQRGEETVTVQTAHALQALSATAAPFEVRIALEFRADVESTVRSLAHSLQILERTARPNVGLAIDVCDLAQIESALRDVEALDLDRLWLVHIDASVLSDDQRRTADSPTPKDVCAHLRGRGFRGPFSVRPSPDGRSLVERVRVAQRTAAELLTAR